MRKFIVGKPGWVVALVQIEDDGLRVWSSHRDNVVRECTRNVSSPVGLIRLEHIHPEHYVTGRQLLAIGPLVVLQCYRDGLVVIGIYRWISQAQSVVDENIGPVTEEVEGAVHQELELRKVGD